MAHTPGPWTVSGISGGQIYKSNYPYSATFVADCNSSITDDDMQKDNARLIAAAPDLLDALREQGIPYDGSLCFCGVAIGNPMQGGHSKRCGNAQAAIAKAEGR